MMFRSSVSSQRIESGRTQKTRQMAQHLVALKTRRLPAVQGRWSEYRER